MWSNMTKKTLPSAVVTSKPTSTHGGSVTVSEQSDTHSNVNGVSVNAHSVSSTTASTTVNKDRVETVFNMIASSDTTTSNTTSNNTTSTHSTTSLSSSSAVNTSLHVGEPDEEEGGLEGEEEDINMSQFANLLAQVGTVYISLVY